MRILIIQLRQLGDILLTTPCIRALAADHQVDFFAHSMGRKVLEGNPHLGEVIYYNEKDGLADHFRLFQTLRKNRYDVVFDYMNNPRSALFTLISGAKSSWSFKSSRRFAYGRVIPTPDSSHYVVETKFALLRAAGFTATDVSLDLPVGLADQSAGIALTKMCGKSDSPMVFLSPTHRRSMRKWPSASWLELAEWLVSSKKANVCWVWGPGEEDEVKSLWRNCAVSTWFAPPSKFKELAAMMERADLFIGNSNGPSHIAVAAKTPSIQLHGHTDARSWCPPSPEHISIQSPIWQTDPVNAMTAISVDDVKEAVEMHWPRVCDHLFARMS